MNKFNTISKLSTLSIIAGLFLTSVQFSNAKEYYKWVDKNGSTHYTTTPPPKTAKQKGKVETYGAPPSSKATQAKNQEQPDSPSHSENHPSSPSQSQTQHAAQSQQPNRTQSATEQPNQYKIETQKIELPVTRPATTKPTNSRPDTPYTGPN